MSSLFDKAIYEVAREIARDRLPATHNYDDITARCNRWHTLALEAQPEAEAKINAMTPLEFLKLLSEMLDNELD